MRREVECRATWFGMSDGDESPTDQPVEKLTLELNDAGHDAGELAELVQQAIAKRDKQWSGHDFGVHRIERLQVN